MRWAQKKFDELKGREAQNAEEEHREALARRRLMDEAPQVWQQLLLQIRTMAAEFNDLRPNYVRLSELSGTALREELTLTSPKCEIRITFYGMDPHITYFTHRSDLGPGTHGTFSVFFTKRDNNAGLHTENGHPITMAHAAERLLNFLF